MDYKNEWVSKKISDVCLNIYSGGTPLRKKSEYFKNGDIIWIKSKELNDGPIYDSEEKITKTALNKSSAKLFPTNTILVAMYGATVGKLGILKKRASTNQAICGMITNEKIINYKFLYYSLLHYRNSLISQAFGAAQQNINQLMIKKFEIKIPPLNIQNKIAGYLSQIDDLVEVNMKRIRVLEELARSLYDEWFVRLRFPGHEDTEITQTEHGPTPKGWKHEPIGKVIETLGGGTPSTNNNAFWDNGNIEWYTPSDLTSNNAMFITESSRKITKKGLQKSSAKLFPAYSVMMTSRATLGVVSINTKEACTNQGFITCVPNEKLSEYYLFFWINQNVEIIINLASGATFKEINKTTFRKIPILIPDSEIMNLFIEKMESLGALIENLLNKNKNLKKCRDMLLPKLISGEIDISDLDIAV